MALISIGTELILVPNFPLMGQTEAIFNKSVEASEQMKENHIRAWISPVRGMLELAPAYAYPAVTSHYTALFGNDTVSLHLQQKHLLLTSAHCCTWKLTSITLWTIQLATHMVVLVEQKPHIWEERMGQLQQVPTVSSASVSREISPLFSLLTPLPSPLHL